MGVQKQHTCAASIPPAFWEFLDSAAMVSIEVGRVKDIAIDVWAQTLERLSTEMTHLRDDKVEQERLFKQRENELPQELE